MINEKSNLIWTWNREPITLWDVQLYMAQRLVSISQNIMQIRLCVFDRERFTDGEKAKVRKALEAIINESEFLGIQGTSEFASVFLTDLNSLDRDTIFDRNETLESVFALGIQKINLAFIPASKMRYLSDSEILFGAEFRTAFPNANHEVSEASKAFAAERYTACVFHLIRALEHGLRAVASGLGLPDPIKGSDRNWRNMLATIKGQIDSNNRQLANDATWQRDKEFYEKAYAFLEGVRNPVRNATMHIEADYDEQSATDILNACSTFMRHLATKLAE